MGMPPAAPAFAVHIRRMMHPDFADDLRLATHMGIVL